MGVRSETENEVIVFIHASDAESWAEFLQKKLCSDDYKIQSCFHAPHHDHVPDLFSSAKICAVLVSPSMLEQDHSSFWSRCVDLFHQQTVFLFLGVNREDLRACLGEDITQRILEHRWLEVDGSQGSVANALIGLIEAYESADCSHLENVHEDSVFGVGGDETSTEQTDADPFCDDEIIYDYPPAPRQQNGILRVIPTVLYECGSHDVLVLLEREAEDTIAMTAETGCGPSRHINVERVTSSAYMATLPDDVLGKVNLSVLAGKYNLGHVTVCVQSSMVQLRCLLQKETSPLKLICNAMGVSGASCSDVEELDSALAQRLTVSQFPSGLLGVMHSDDQATAADREDSRWPTLLHFAAEFNLTRVCDELLRYPGMIHAACTENSEGLFPCQVAQKKGFHALQKRLIRYVEDMRLRRSAADSGISFTENLPPPPRHCSTSHSYINECPMPGDLLGSSDADYIQMTGPHSCQRANAVVLSTYHGVCSEVCNEEPPQGSLPSPRLCFSKLLDGYAKPRSYSEGCVKTPYARIPSEARIAEEEDGKENEPPPLKPKLGRARSAASECLPYSYTPSTQPRPESGGSESSDSEDCYIFPPNKQLHNPGSSGNSHSQAESTSRPSAETQTCRSSESRPASELRQRSSITSEQVSWQLGKQTGSRPESQASTSSSLSSNCEVSLAQQWADSDVSPAAACSQEKPVLRTKESKRSKSVQDKISNFFKKMSRRNYSSEGDLPVMAKGHKKPVVYGRQSTVSTSSDPSGYLSASLRSNISSMCSDSERDSGAVCDDHDSPVLLRSRGKGRATPRNSGKRNGASMQRRVSIRVQRARNEDLSETPTLPSRGSTAEAKETFVSFIK